ncbi:unnamed protein product [Rotaria sp. Silwood2]|nr:unnamed protein product [Rotaria sp. Silwood2]
MHAGNITIAALVLQLLQINEGMLIEDPTNTRLLDARSNVAKTDLTFMKEDDLVPFGVDLADCRNWADPNGTNCNAYTGDTLCSTELPVLCVKLDNSPRSSFLVLGNGAAMPVYFYVGWNRGHIATTLSVTGSKFARRTDIDMFCAKSFGVGWCVATFHDGMCILGMNGATYAGDSWTQNIDAIQTGSWHYYSYDGVRNDVWDSCCACLGSFGIISKQLLHECPQTDCGYQYCNKCVESIKNCNSNINRQFYCMYCNHSSTEGPQQNKFLINLLWEHFNEKYDVDLLSTIDIMPGTLSNDISCRIDHIQCLIETLKQRKPNMSSIPGDIQIGLIGETSVGKTSLLIHLRNIDYYDTDNSKTEITIDRRILSPVRVGKSTLCQLEFDHQYIDGTEAIFVDIEGSTDYDTDLESGNYFDEIRKADCDLYILVFDNRFADMHKNWHNYIVNELKRECWLVRNKIDDLFLQTFKEDVGQEFNSSSEAKRNRYAESIIKRIRESVSSGTNGIKLYLTFSSCDTDGLNENLSKEPYGKFDLEKLIDDIKNLPHNFHANRLQKMCVTATAKIINNCFRRSYVVSVMKYKIYAGVAAVVPFADLIPRYLGREAIRQAFGVNCRSRFIVWWTAFKNTFQLRSPAIKTNINAGTSIVSRSAAAVGIAGVAISDDVLRLSGVGVINAVRGLSISFIVVGVALTEAMCAWSAVSNGKQMYNYLNRLCDDIILISEPLALKILNGNDDICESFLIVNE